MSYSEKFAIPEPSPELKTKATSLIHQIESAYGQQEQILLLEQLNKLFTTQAELTDVLSHSGAESTDSYVLRNFIPNPRDFSQLAEEELLWLVGNLLANVTDDRKVHFHSAILDLNFAVPEGTTLGIIFHSPANTPELVLDALARERKKTTFL